MPRQPVSGIALAAVDNPEHAAAISAMKEQLLIVLVNRLVGSGDLIIPAAEIDATAGFVLALSANPETRTFRFSVQKKQ